MNNLSWLIYLANLSENLGILTRLICGVCVLSMVLAGILWLASEGEVKPSKRMAYGLIAIAFFSATFGALLPSQRTVYLIAASEAGQQVAQSDSGKALLDETQKLLLKKLRQYSGEDKP